MKGKKYYLKLFGIYLVMMCLYTTLFIAMFFSKNAEIAKLQIDSQYSHAIRQAQENIDTKMVIGQSLINQLITSETVSAYTMQGQRDYYTISKVFQEIKDNNSSFVPVGCSVAAAKFGDNLVITPQYTIGLERFYQQMGFDYEKRKQIQGLTAIADNDQDSAFVTSVTEEGIKTFTIVQVKQLANGKKLTVFISYPIEKLFPTVSKENEIFFMYKGKEWVSNAEKVEPALSAALEEIITADISMNEQRKTADGYYIYTSKSRESSWRYIYAVPKSVFLKERTLLMIQVLMIYLGLLALGLFLVYIITNRMYGPIRRILNHFGGAGEDQDEMLFIADAVHEMQEKNKSLTDVVQANTASLENKFLKSLLDGTVAESEILKLLGRYQLQWMHQNILSVVLEFANQKELEELFTRNGLMVLKSEILEIVREQLRQETAFKIVEYDYKRYAVILKYTDKERIIQIFFRVLSMLEMDFEITVVASIGEPCSGALELAREFENTIGVLEERSPLDRRIILTGREIQQGGLFYYPLETERRIIEAATKGERDVVHHLIQVMMKENFEKRILDDRAYAALIMALTGTLNRALQQAGKQSEEVFGDSMNLYLELRMCESKEMLRGKLEELFDTFIHNTSISGEEQDNRMAQNMIRFVQEHYHEDISLMDLGQAFNLSTCYISTLFKQYTGENFKDYLNTKRIEKAKQLLQKGNVQVKEVGEQVGYLNTPSFIRAFRRYEGTSPGQYMKNHQE